MRLMKSVLIAAVAAAIFVSLIFQAAICGWFGLSLKNEVRPLEAVTLATNLPAYPVIGMEACGQQRGCRTGGIGAA